jgi:tRNA1(Val) A37 N6-methylase TrmN6
MATKGRLSTKQIKERGAHYTPPELARFLAVNVASYLPRASSYRILDPACGDGELLEALALHLPPDVRRTSTFFGMENDEHALADTQHRLSSLPDPPRLELIHANFLAWTRDFSQPRMFDLSKGPDSFDAVIANPPYVRTQVMGANNAQKLALQFGLTGRVDLYHAFALAMTQVLREGGVLGLLCSNRFLSIQSGESLRKVLLQDYELHDIFDLGDTKLFEAAVLPAIVIGTKRGGVAYQDCRFTRIYELHNPDGVDSKEFPDVLSAVESDMEGAVRVEDTVFLIERGSLAVPADGSRPWRISSPEMEDWLATIKNKAPYTFSDLVKIRVGIKTTADNIFIRDDWSSLPLEMQPEPNVLRPLLSNDVAAQWWPLPAKRQPYVLYTHIVKDGKRSVIDLDKLPRTRRYLEAHKEQLTGRKYVLEAGRQWYEIWVPQNPSDWRRPKVVFSDISSSPRFYLDKSGSIVDGNCYWFVSEEEDLLYLLLAVANSTFILRFYDAVCGNKLYAGRRRFITQYVGRFPVPDPHSDIARKIITKTKQICSLPRLSKEANRVTAEVDCAVGEFFGLVEEVAR